jgi:hypothetical protein
MSAFSIQDAHDLSAFAAQILDRLAQATQHLADANGALADEITWLESAARRVGEGHERTHAALREAAPLPEFANARKVKSEELSNAWADAVEKVFDGIVANVSANGPLVEALFPHQRFASLRKAGTSAQNFWNEFERRADSAYVRRLCQDPDYEFLSPLLAAARESEKNLRELISPKPLPEAQATKLRDDVSAAAEKLELALRQTRSLCEAAFAATPALVAELGLDAKPKRRVQRSEKPAISAN